jgi:hypothetical protein
MMVKHSLALACSLISLSMAVVLPAMASCPILEASDHEHPPGDPAWIGHHQQDLVSVLGSASFSLGKTYWESGGPVYEIDVYTSPQPVSMGCVDAYKRNICGEILDYFCM